MCATAALRVPAWIAGVLLTGACLCPGGDHVSQPRSLRVSPADEVTVIDPGTNSTGKPEPLVTEGRVEIPPAIIVHNYYYTGDRDFRGPVFPGGPAIVVVEHPQTGQRLYLDVQMLPGSPRIVYRRHWIDYHFGSQRIRIQFHNPLRVLHPHEPVVKFCAGNESIQEARSTPARSLRAAEWLRRTGIPEAVSTAGRGAGSLADRSADGIRRVGEAASAPVKRLVQATPVGSLLDQNPEAAATRARDESVAAARSEGDAFIRTQR